MMRFLLLKNVFFTAAVSLSVSGCSVFNSAPETTTQDRFFSLIEGFHDTPTPTTEKVDQLTQSLMGIPYVDGNLGEGEQGQYDQDPLMRFDAFDCTTYVETIIAGVQADSADDFLAHLNTLRYQNGQISFVKRNHFPSADWLLNNQHALTEVTAQVGGPYTLYADTVIDKNAWYQSMGPSRIQLPKASPAEQQRALSQLQQEGLHFSPQAVSTPYIPLTAIFVPQQASPAQRDARQQRAHAIEQDHTLSSEARTAALRQLALSTRLEDAHLNQSLLDRIPSGSVISIVRPNYEVKQWIGTNMNITHQAIAWRKEGRLYLRHASQLQRKVVEQDFVDYFSRYVLSGTVKGFNIQALKH